MTEPVWRPVVGFEESYEVSDQGHVRSVDRIIECANGNRSLKGRMLRPTLGQHYFHLNLTVGGTAYERFVHTLVCEAFHGARPDTTMVIRHLNGDGTDNRAANLAWGTPAENSADTKRHGRNYWSNKTHCKQGHEFTLENTRVSVVKTTGRVRRNCRECQRIASAPVNRKRSQLKREQLKPRICRTCGDSFISWMPQAKSCSPACTRVWHRNQRRMAISV